MPDHTIRKYIDLIRQASGKWSNWDPPFPVYVGDYGTFNDNGELTVEGNVHHDEFQQYIHDKGFNGNLDLKPYPPEVAESTENITITSSGVKKEEFNVDQHANASGIASSSLFKGTWKFPGNKRGALIVLVAPRQIRISQVALEKILEDRLLEDKYLVTSVFACPAYIKYLSNKSGESLSVSLRARPAGLGAVNLGEWWTDKESDMLRAACHPNIKYRYTPLFTLQRIAERPWSVWKKDENAGDYVWQDVYPTWKPLDHDGEEYDD